METHSSMGRPGIATDPAKPGVIQTSFGLLDPNPTTGEQILPRNFGRGPAIILFASVLPRHSSWAAEGKPTNRELAAEVSSSGASPRANLQRAAAKALEGRAAATQSPS